MLISGRDPHADPLESYYGYDHHGCTCPFTMPPCSHCVDCYVCSPACSYCFEEHGDPQNDQCPQIEWDLAMERLLL